MKKLIFIFFQKFGLNLVKKLLHYFVFLKSIVARLFSKSDQMNENLYFSTYSNQVLRDGLMIKF